MKFFAFIFLFAIAGPSGFSQSWFTAGGVRLGTDWGLTLQQRLARKTSAEFILQSSLSRDEGMLTILGKKHTSLLSRRFNLFLGGGYHTGWNNGGIVAADYKGPKGLTLIAGAEATIGRVNVSYDFKPAINIVGGESPLYFQTGASLRYVIAKDSFLEPDPKKKRQRARAKRKKEREKEKQQSKSRFRLL
jgi:hypothetical protein